MAIEAGGKAGLIEVDDITRAYMDGRTERPYTEYHSDPDAVYAHGVRDRRRATSRPPWRLPHLPSNTRPAAESRDVEDRPGRHRQLHQRAHWRTCARRRAVLRGRKVHPDVRCIVIPGNARRVSASASRKGLMDVFLDANCAVSTPTCGPCLGGYMGILAAGERCRFHYEPQLRRPHGRPHVRGLSGNARPLPRPAPCSGASACRKTLRNNG